MEPYDIRAVFEQMELELIASMKRNLQRHQKWEKDEGMNWTMWQTEQLKTLEQFKRENKKIFNKKFADINEEITDFLTRLYKTSGVDQEKAILEQIAFGKGIKDDVEIKKSWFDIPLNERHKHKISDYIIAKKKNKGLDGAFFSLNEDKMQALINAVVKDMSKAEHAMLRMVDDQYRKTIFKAQVMANSGAFTLKQSIDMATKDFLKAGINCIQYKDGRRVNIASYSEMAIRTANKRAILISEGDARNAYGIHTVRISKYGQCSETCLPWQGKVYVDDVYSGGTKEEAGHLNLQLLSVAIAGGLFHPNCKHRSTTYFYDLKKSQGKLQDDRIENPPEEQEHRKNRLHIQQQQRLETGSLDSQNIAEAKTRKEQWIDKDEDLGWGPLKKAEKTIKRRPKENLEFDSEQDLANKIKQLEEQSKEYELKFLETLDDEAFFKSGELIEKVKELKEQYKNTFGKEYIPIETLVENIFKPGGTIEEAQNLINKYSKYGYTTVDDKVTLEQANAVAERMYEINKKFGYKIDVRHINNDVPKGMSATYIPYDMSNTREIKNLAIKGNYRSWHNGALKAKGNNKWNAATDDLSVFDHELGHAIWFDLPKETQNKIEMVYKRYADIVWKESGGWDHIGKWKDGTSLENYFSKYLSGYGYSNKEEFFAEAFSEIMSSQENRLLAQEIEDILLEKNMIPEIKIPPDGLEKTFKIYTDEEIMNFAYENELILDNHLSKKASGVVKLFMKIILKQKLIMLNCGLVTLRRFMKPHRICYCTSNYTQDLLVILNLKYIGNFKKLRNAVCNC